MSLRVDKNTGKHYTYHNIPLPRNYRKGQLTAIQDNGTLYKIFAQNHSHPLDSWYNDTFIGDKYAVFVETSFGFQQVSKWYNRYGYAVRIMAKMAETLNEKR